MRVMTEGKTGSAVGVLLSLLHEPGVPEHLFPDERESLGDDVPLGPAGAVHSRESVAPGGIYRLAARIDDLGVEWGSRGAVYPPRSGGVVEEASLFAVNRTKDEGAGTYGDGMPGRVGRMPRE